MFRDFIDFIRAFDLAERRAAVNSAVPLNDNQEACDTNSPIAAQLDGAKVQWRSPLQELADSQGPDIKLLSLRDSSKLSFDGSF